MIELPPDRSTISPWLIWESGDRWANAARRFVPELMPRPWIASIVSVGEPIEGSALPTAALSAHSRAVVLWEIDPSHFSHACDSLAAIAVEHPSTLRLAAARGLSDRRRILVSELAVAATIDHPEDLPSLAGMLQAYFASPGHLLD